MILMDICNQVVFNYLVVLGEGENSEGKSLTVSSLPLLF